MQEPFQREGRKNAEHIQLFFDDKKNISNFSSNSKENSETKIKIPEEHTKIENETKIADFLHIGKINSKRKKPNG